MSADVWVAVSFAIFFLILIYFGVPALLTKALDDRADLIRSELEEARRLKEEAQGILADYQRKREEAEKEAADIVEQARMEAEALANETRKSMQDMVERRTRMAEQKIARAEEQAASEVRSAAAEVAVSAVRDVLGQRLSGSAKANEIMTRSISELGSKLN